MIKIIDGIGFERVYVPGSFVVRSFERNGVLERSVRPLSVLKEIDAPRVVVPELSAFDKRNMEPTPEMLDAWEKQAQLDAEANRAKNAAKAKTVCRRIIIAEGFDELLTLTYRANQTDRKLCKKHFKEWVRRMTRAIPSFRYCASFERQERGAMHVHLATHKLPQHAVYKGVKIEAWKLGTAVWRSIVGQDNGLCFVGGNTKWNGKRRRLSLAKMAGYVSKYIMKDWEDVPKGENRYSHSMGDATATARALRPHYLELHGTTFPEVIATVFECGEGDTLQSWSINAINDTMWLVKEAG